MIKVANCRNKMGEGERKRPLKKIWVGTLQKQGIKYEKRSKWVKKGKIGG